MKKLNKKKLFILSVLIILISFTANVNHISAKESSYIILSHYYKSMDIGEQFYLTALTSTGKMPSFKSSNPKTASVNRYGFITAKKAGTAAITAKSKNCAASCIITVHPTTITLDTNEIILEHNQCYRLAAHTSNASQVKWKTSKKATAAVDSNGLITGGKPGTAIITATADGYRTTCKVTVKKPDITISNESLSLYKNITFNLTASVSSGISPKWKSSRSSVASVDSNGLVTAHKNGTAIITVSADGSSKCCKITVLKPKITLFSDTITLKAGQRKKIIATVSSGNTPKYKSSNSRIASVSSTGCVTALKKGTAFITISEDGTKVKCKINVT